MIQQETKEYYPRKQNDNLDYLIQNAILEYEEYGDDYCNEQVYSFKEKIKTKKQFS